MRKEEALELFNSLPIGKPITLLFNSPYQEKLVTIKSKFRHSEYSYSVFAVDIDGKTGGHFWLSVISPFKSRGIIGFIDNE
jgi:hypothetical protein